jgi:tricorn protease
MRTLVLLLAISAAGLAAGVPYFTEPALCPTRPEIAFVSGGDIWVAPAKGGEAHLLVSHPADESRPLYSPDGNRLAFVSTRTGNGDIYVLTLGTGELKRLTFDDGLDQLDGWSRDGHWIYFSSGSHDVGRKNDIYRVSADGGTPMPVSADRFVNEFQAAPAPDGTTLAFAARGNGDQQWWRNGHSHLDESEIWIRKDGSPSTYERVVDLNGRNHWPMWMPDGRQIYFMSDRGGAQNIWTMTLAGKPRQVTKFASGRVLWPSISYDGKAVVFEHDFKIWQLDTKTSEAFEVPLKLVGSAAGPVTTHTMLNQFTDLALSPDAKKMALIGHGEVFAASAKDGGEAIRVTQTPGPEAQLAWAPDSARIVYTGERDAVNHLFLYDFAHHAETQLTHDSTPDQAPRFSPDGKSIAFIRDRRELRVIETESKQQRLVVAGSFGGGFGAGGSLAWSPDGKWIAYSASGDRGLRNLYVVPAAGGAPHQISFLANASAGFIQWSPEGTFLLFVTNQRTETPQIARIDLTPRQPNFTEERFEDLFKPDPPRDRGAGAAADRKPPVKPVEIVFEGIRDRISMLPVGLDVSNPQISPDGRSLLLLATVGGQQNLYLFSLDEVGRGGRGGRELRVARQLTSTAGRKSHAQFSPDSKEVYYLEAGRVQAIGVDNRQTRAVAVNAEMDVDFNREKMAVFEEAWAGQRDNFYDPKMHGIDWNAVRKTYAPLIEGARTPDEMRRLLRLMVGELNSSHSGVSAPALSQDPAETTPRGVVGQLGLSFDRSAYEKSGTLRITEVLPNSPAAIAKIQPGEELRAVDRTLIGTHVNLDELLEHRIDKRVVLDISGRQVTVRPAGTLAEQIYRKWVEDNRAYVTRVSGGRLGYVHIRDMSAQALTQLYLDLDSENRAKDGVVIDVRNNNGGFVNAYALDVLARRGYMTMTNRGAPPAPARTLLGQRSLELPTVLVVNQHSLSDAEDFTEGYRTLKLGKVVGESTAGWIIYTGAMELVDGSSMRLPGTLITGADGKNMENNPRPVDVAVSRPIGESYTGKDSQLDAAVKQLLGDLGSK